MEKRPPVPPPRARLAPPPPSRAIPQRPAPPPSREYPTVAQPAAAPPAPAGSTAAMILTANTALRLRDEQLRANVQYYNVNLRTNAELDAITAQVVAELKVLTSQQRNAQPSAEIEAELVESLRGLLEKLFSKKRSGFLTRKLDDVQRRITQLFFSSELYASIAADGKEVLAATWPEQALYFALKRHEDALLVEIGSMPVGDPSVKERAIERLQAFQRQLCSDFLSKTTPELERLLAIYRKVLTHFFVEVFPRHLGVLCAAVIRESRVAENHSLGYKITADRFDDFREAFDGKFLEHLVLNVQGPISKLASESTDQFREATLRFVDDPTIHTEICSAVNDAVYDYLHGEGFLDLPGDWRRLLSR